MRRVVLSAVFLVVAACSSEEQLNPQPLPPQGGEGAARDPAPPSASTGTCSGTCCDRPADGAACDATEDSTCSWARVCPEGGLVIPYEVTCTNGTWKETNGCPKQGESDERGCPATQPAAGTSCVTAIQCGYVLECTGYRKSVQSTCNGATWQSTTTLGTCD